MCYFKNYSNYLHKPISIRTLSYSRFFKRIASRFYVYRAYNIISDYQVDLALRAA